MLTNFVIEFNLDILCISETWLLDSVPSSFVNMQGFSIVRTDTLGPTAKHGVCVYIKSGLSFQSVDTPIHNLHCVKLIEFDIYIIVVYRPPSNTPEDNALLAAYITEFCLDK